MFLWRDVFEFEIKVVVLSEPEGAEWVQLLQLDGALIPEQLIIIVLKCES